MLVEDNPGDVQLFNSFVAGPYHVTVAKSGAEAMDRLFHRDPFDRSPKPDIVVLDLNLPLLNGHEVLNAIKANSELRSIPTIVFSVSDQEDDIRKAYEFGASAYVVKPRELEEAERILSAFAAFWVQSVAYPALRRDGYR